VFTDPGPVRVRENVLVIVIVPTPLFEGSAMLMAVSVTPGGAVRTCGAVYVPDELTVPQAFPVHPFPATIHVTFLSGLPVEFTLAVKARAAPSSTGMVWGDTETVMSLRIATEAAAVFVLSAVLVACTVTEAGIGKSPGAV
jgi:hypothetical protein